MKTNISAARAIRRILACALLGLVVGPALAQSEKSVVKILVGYPAGAGADALARIYADALHQTLNVSTVVENKPGAGGQIAAVALKTASPDTPTLMLTMDHQVVMIPLITRNPGFDPKTDMVPVARLVSFNTCLAVSSNLPAQTLGAYAEAVKTKPELGNYGIPAPGSQAQFVGYVVGKHYGVPMNPIPYRGAAPAIIDLIGGQVPSVVVPCDALAEHRKSGKVRILGIAADKRSPAMPDVPTFDELGVKMPTDNFVGVYAPATMKPELLRQVVEATRRMLQSPQVVERLNATGMTASYASPDEMRSIVGKATAFWGEQVRLTHFQAE